MQSVKVDDVWMQNIFDGRKQNTIRMGHKDITLGPLNIISTSGISESVWCNEVNIKMFGNINYLDALGGFHRNIKECKNVLISYYPEIDDSSVVTVIWFKWR